MLKGSAVKTIILAGGFGMRIRDVAADIPKPMIPVGPYPILVHVMKIYGAAGFRNFIICLGYKGDVIKQYFLNYKSNFHDINIHVGNLSKIEYLLSGDKPVDDWEIVLADTGLNAMTGARVRAVRRYVEPDDIFMLTYGDGVSNVALRRLVEFHRWHGRLLTITGVRPPGRFGELEVDGSTVTGFNEKPQASGGLISGGFFVCSRRIFDYLEDREDLVFEQEPMRRLVADREVAVYEHNDFWHPLDTYRDYKLLNDLWDREQAPWKTW